MTSHFEPGFFIANRKKLKQLFTGTAPIVVAANGLLQRSADSTFQFRQDSSFWYLTGINEPDILLVLDKDKEYLIVPGRSASREAFDGAVDYEDLSTVSGITDIYDDKTGWEKLNKRLAKVQHVATLAAAPAYIKAHGMYVNPARQQLISKLRSVSNSLELLDLRPQMTKMRMTKQPQELAAIRQAIDVTIEAFDSVKQQLSDFSHEYEIDAAVSFAFQNQGRKHAYTPIVAGGKNACTLHYVANSDSVSSESLILIDAGAEVENYAADITRTYIADKASDRQQQVWQAVIDVQEYAISQLKPGILLGDYEKSVESFMGEKLRELGLIKTISHETVRKYYPHSTSHYLGLDVHDAADYERPLEHDMVLTVEPGIYIPEESIGIRIEDNVRITGSGVEILSAELSREM